MGILTFISQIILWIGMLIYFNFPEYPFILVIAVSLSSIIACIYSIWKNKLQLSLDGLWNAYHSIINIYQDNDEE